MITDKKLKELLDGADKLFGPFNPTTIWMRQQLGWEE